MILLGNKFLKDVFDLIVEELEPITGTRGGYIYDEDITDQIGLSIENANYYETN